MIQDGYSNLVDKNQQDFKKKFEELTMLEMHFPKFYPLKSEEIFQVQIGRLAKIPEISKVFPDIASNINNILS